MEMQDNLSYESVRYLKEIRNCFDLVFSRKKYFDVKENIRKVEF